MGAKGNSERLPFAPGGGLLFDGIKTMNTRIKNKTLCSLRRFLAGLLIATSSSFIQPGKASGALTVFDPTFGSEGRITADFGEGRDDQAFALAIQPDGRLILAGRASLPNLGDDFALARFNPDGSLDASFGSGGKVTTHFGLRDRASAILLQPDGRILASGDIVNSRGSTDFAIIRYNSDGSLDSSFGNQGKVQTDLSISDTANAAALQQDGKILIAGSAYNRATGRNFALVRYNPNGSLDLSFGNQGKVMTDFAAASDEIAALAIQSDGRIIAAGFAANSASGRDFALARYNADGALDTSFGSGGRVTLDYFASDDEAKAVAIDSSGRIVIAGSAFNGATLADFAVARFTAEGKVDDAFGAGGKVATDFFANLDAAQSLAELPNGRLFVAGRSFRSGSDSDFALVCLTATGSLDEGFGTGGKLTTDFFGLIDEAYAMELDALGRAVVGGRSTASGANPDFALARYILAEIPGQESNIRKENGLGHQESPPRVSNFPIPDCWPIEVHGTRYGEHKGRGDLAGTQCCYASCAGEGVLLRLPGQRKPAALDAGKISSRLFQQV